MERRIELQNYLQKLFSINKKILVYKSKVLHSFFEFNNRHTLSINLMKHTKELMTARKNNITNDNDENDLLDDDIYHDGLKKLVGLNVNLKKISESEDEDKINYGSYLGQDSDINHILKEDSYTMFLQDSNHISDSANPSGSSKYFLILINITKSTLTFIQVVVFYIWDLCKTEYWIVIIAVILLLMNKYDSKYN
jgi:hypothetical protein